MARRKGLKIPGVSFSMNRALGITSAKRKFAKATGIPTTKAGMQRKVGRAVTGGGCLLPVILAIAALAVLIIAIT